MTKSFQLALFSRYSSGINQWLAAHEHFIEEICRFPEFKFEILFLVENYDDAIDVPKIRNCLCSTFFESWAKRLQYLTSWLNPESIFLPLASDDYIVSCDFKGLSEVFLSRRFAGVIPLTYWDEVGGEIAPSSYLTVDEDDALRRMKKYLAPPFPGENSFFWGCFQGGVYRSSLRRLAILESEKVRAWDWLLVAELLSRGRFLSGSNMLIKVRGCEPISKYHDSVVSRETISLRANPLYSTLKAMEKLFFIPDFRMELLSWVIVKSREQQSLGLIENFSELDIERIIGEFDSTFGYRS